MGLCHGLCTTHTAFKYQRARRKQPSCKLRFEPSITIGTHYNCFCINKSWLLTLLLTLHTHLSGLLLLLEVPFFSRVLHCGVAVFSLCLRMLHPEVSGYCSFAYALFMVAYPVNFIGRCFRLQVGISFEVNS